MIETCCCRESPSSNSLECLIVIAERGRSCSASETVSVQLDEETEGGRGEERPGGELGSEPTAGHSLGERGGRRRADPAE